MRSGRGSISCVATDHAPHARHEKDVPFEEAPFGVTGLETAFAALLTRSSSGSRRSRRVLERMSGGACASVRPARAADRSGRGREPRRCSTSTPNGVDVTEDGFRSRSANSWLLGETLQGQVAKTVAERARGVRAMSGELSRPRGRAPSSAVARSPRDGVAFGEAVFTTGDDRLPGDRHRPELRASSSSASPRRWSATTASPPSEASRASRTRARSRCMRALGGAEWADWLHEHGIVAPRWNRHALARPAAARRGRDARGCALPTSVLPGDRRTRTQVRAQPSMEGQALVARRLHAGAVRGLRRGRARRGSRSSTTGRKRSIMRRLADAGAAVTVFPHTTVCRRAAPGYDGVVLSNGPGDPEPLVDETEIVRGLLGRVPMPRDLPRPPAARPRDRSLDVQAALRPPRRQPSRARARARARARDEPEPRLRRRADLRTREATLRLALRRHGRGLRLPELRARSVQFHPEAEARPARRLADPRALGRRSCSSDAAARATSDSICVIGSGPIVIGQACEFDYAGCQALKVLREDGFRTIVVNSNPATIMTDPGFADRTYIEPLDLEGVAASSSRERPDALPADARRPDGAQPRDRARPKRASSTISASS